ncbi:MAG: Permuted papain-like amidase enzyme YaeF/YiiX, family [Cyanobacteriota bacterium]|jgi:hypothetical protein
MIVIFCKGKNIGSQLIASIDGGPYSHVAISSRYFGNCSVVAHSTHSGVELSHIKQFQKKYNVIKTYEVEVEGDEQSYFLGLLSLYIGISYDWFALIFLGLRKLGFFSKKQENIWQNRNYFICTEFVTRAILGKTNSSIGLVELEKLIKELQDETQANEKT